MTETIEIPRARATTWAETPEVVRDEIVRRFHAAGVMVFDEVFAPAFVAGLLDAYSAAYARYHHDREFDDALKVGDKRNMISVAIEGAFNDPDLYAHPMLLPLMQRLLGDDAILGSFVAITSLPGSDDQAVHLDMPILFEAERAGAEVPSYSLTLVVPMVDMNATNGTTAFHPGSHREISDGPPTSVPVAPDVPVGSALLFDARVWHGGTPNSSDAPRPVLYNTYQRSWFRDTVNFLTQEPLRLTDAERAGIPDEFAFLFDWSRAPGA